MVFDLQDDWDITIKEASVVLIQLCAPRESVKYFNKSKQDREGLKLSTLLNRFGFQATLEQDRQSLSSSHNKGIDALPPISQSDINVALTDELIA